MEKVIRVFSIVLLVMGAVISAGPEKCFAARERFKEELTNDPQLKEADLLYKKGIRYIKDGDGVSSPQRAVQFYKTAESYFNNASAKLKKLGREHSIDVSREIELCEEMWNKAHVRSGMAKRER